MKRTTVLIILLSILATAWIPVKKGKLPSETILHHPILETQKRSTIRFKTLTSTIKSDTSATIELLVDRGDYEEFVSVDCTLRDTDLSFRASYHPNFRNVTVNYSGKLPLK